MASPVPSAASLTARWSAARADWGIGGGVNITPPLSFWFSSPDPAAGVVAQVGSEAETVEVGVDG